MSITSGIPNQMSKNTIWKAKITKWLPEVKFEKPEKKKKQKEGKHQKENFVPNYAILHADVCHSSP